MNTVSLIFLEEPNISPTKAEEEKEDVSLFATAYFMK